jgi:hypothetical protein
MPHPAARFDRLDLVLWNPGIRKFSGKGEKKVIFFDRKTVIDSKLLSYIVI